MLRRLVKPVVAAMLVVSLGLHWPILQMAAWCGMIISYSQESTLGEAFVKTFDGQHPCGLCKVVDEGKNSEKRQQSQLPLKKLDFPLERVEAILFPPAPELAFTPPAPPRRPPHEAPPKPPPRRV